VLAHAGYDELIAERDRLRGKGLLAGIGVAACLEPSGGNSSFEPLLNPKVGTTTWMDSCRISVDLVGSITATMHTTSAGQGHETMVGTVVGEGAGDRPGQGAGGAGVIFASTFIADRTSPVGSRMAIMLGGAAFHAANKIKHKLIAIAAHDLGVPAERIAYKDGNTFDTSAPDRKRSWAELVTMAHRHIHKAAGRYGARAFGEPHHVRCHWAAACRPPTARVQMYPCYSFEFHLILLTIDPDLGKPAIKRYLLGHDCGTVINPKIRARHDHGRHRPRHRRRALRGVRL